MSIINKTALYNYFRIGLKMSAVGVILGLVFWVLMPLFTSVGIVDFLLTIESEGYSSLNFLGIIFISLLFGAVLTIEGYITNKLWGWK